MSEFKTIPAFALEGNVFKRISQEWMLIASGDQSSFNMMTASWGGLGYLWNKSVAFCFIRPQRYTYQFVENQPRFTLSFYGEQYRNALNFCGSKSGRDTDKVKGSGLTPVFADGSVYFAEASTVLICRKIYNQDFDPRRFLDPTIAQNYREKDYHRLYIGEIEKVLVKQASGK